MGFRRGDVAAFVVVVAVVVVIILSGQSEGFGTPVGHVELFHVEACRVP